MIESALVPELGIGLNIYDFEVIGIYCAAFGPTEVLQRSFDQGPAPRAFLWLTAKSWRYTSVRCSSHEGV